MPTINDNDRFTIAVAPTSQDEIAVTLRRKRQHKRRETLEKLKAAMEDTIANEQEGGSRFIKPALDRSFGALQQIPREGVTDETREQALKALGRIEHGGAQFEQVPLTPADDKSRTQLAQEHFKAREAGKEGYMDKKSLAFNPERLQMLMHKPSEEVPSALTHLEHAGLYDRSKEKREAQEKENEDNALQDYRTVSFGARRLSKQQGGETVDIGAPQKDMRVGGKLAGKALTNIASSGEPGGAMIIYGLALLNDIPDLGDWVLELLLTVAAGVGPLVDFFFDMVVFLGFRYFLRQHIHVAGVCAILYTATILEWFPGPLDSLPFWTLCAWLALRKIKEEQEAQQSGQTRYAASQMRRRRLQAAMRGA